MKIFEFTESERGSIGFPNLGIDDFNPCDGIRLFGFEIKFYGIIIAFGLFLAVIYAIRRAKQFGLTTDDILDIVLIGTPCGIIGARLYYVITGGLPVSEWLNIRDGGMAIYGGVIGAVGSVAITFLLSKKRRKKLLPCMDIAGLGFMIGQSIGRWGNFFNREAFGGYSDGLFAMRLSAHRIRNLADASVLQKKVVDGMIQVQPTFLYESVWNLIGFVLIHFLSKKRKFDGQVFLYYLAWYGLGRLYIEGMRTDSLMVGPFRVSQLLAGITCLIAVGILVYMLAIKKPTGKTMLVSCVIVTDVPVTEETEQAVEETMKSMKKQEEES